MKKIAFLGCGAIGTIVAQYVRDERFAEIAGLYDLYPEAAERLKEKVGTDARIVDTVEDLIELEPDIIIEAASPEAAAKYDPIILEKTNVLSLDTGIMSTMYTQLKEITERTGNRIYFPSGAVGGIDAIRAMAQEGIEELVITTTKKPISLGKKDIQEKTELFYGKASDAIKEFPRNINVAVTLSYAADKEADVRIVADPEIDSTQHEIYARSKHTEFYSRIKNIPSEDNPRTSYVAALSTIQMLKQALGYYGGVQIGN